MLSNDNMSYATHMLTMLSLAYSRTLFRAPAINDRAQFSEGGRCCQRRARPTWADPTQPNPPPPYIPTKSSGYDECKRP